MLFVVSRRIPDWYIRPGSPVHRIAGQRPARHSRMRTSQTSSALRLTGKTFPSAVDSMERPRSSKKRMRSTFVQDSNAGRRNFPWAPYGKEIPRISPSCVTLTDRYPKSGSFKAGFQVLLQQEHAGIRPCGMDRTEKDRACAHDCDVVYLSTGHLYRSISFDHT